jgi:hypothetical protein
LRQAGTALLLWYAAALVLPAGLIAATSSSTPVGGGGRVDSCTGGINCLLDAPDGGDVFRLAAGFLALSLVIAVPLCAYLLRSWKLPVLAATVATFSAWFLTPMIWCGGLALLAR